MSAAQSGSPQGPSGPRAVPRLVQSGPRAFCHACGEDVPLRANDTLGEHRNFWWDRPSTLCKGSGEKRKRAVV